MDESRRRALLGASGLGKCVLRDLDRKGEADYERAKAAVYQQHPLSAARRQQLLGASPLGRAVQQHERQLLQQTDG